MRAYDSIVPVRHRLRKVVRPELYIPYATDSPARARARARTHHTYTQARSLSAIFLIRVIAQVV